MTLFCGLLTLNPDSRLGTHLVDELKVLCKKNNLAAVGAELHDAKFSIFSVDIGAFEYSGIIYDSTALTCIVGDPVLDEGGERNRAADAKYIHDSFRQDGGKALRSCRGVFSGLFYNKTNNELKIFTDKLGIRPVYYYIKDGVLLFSSIQEYLLNLPSVDKECDLIGSCERLAAKYCFGHRTPYKYISLLKSGEVVSALNGKISSNRYFRFEEKVICLDKYEDKVREAFHHFEEGVKLRCSGSDGAAFLSGGLDSRCVTAALRPHVERLYTFNFSTSESQDKVFARLYSKKLISDHVEKVFESLSFPNWSQLISAALSETEVSEGHVKPHIVWSGDGGSVGAGFVYLDKSIIDLYEEGRIDASTNAFLRENKLGVPINLFKRKFYKDIKDVLANSIKHELMSVSPDGAGKEWYLFLMYNDQRRHLFTHFETIDRHRVELQLPFFDSEFLSTVISVPIDKCLYHGFYMDWFQLFPSFARETPWQTYPKHVPCTILYKDKLSYQWEKYKSSKSHSVRREESANLLNLYNRSSFAQQYFSGYKVRLASLLHRFSVRDCSYFVEAMEEASRIC